MLAIFLLITLAAADEKPAPPESPCPTVFKYESSSETGVWSGVLTLFSDSTVHSLWLDIVLDGKANLLGTETGEVTTKNNIHYEIRNSELKILPNKPVEAKFFVRFNELKPPPKIAEIRFNSREICNSKFPAPVNDAPKPDVYTNPTVTEEVDTFSGETPERPWIDIGREQHTPGPKHDRRPVPVPNKIDRKSTFNGDPVYPDFGQLTPAPPPPPLPRTLPKDCTSGDSKTTFNGDPVYPDFGQLTPAPPPPPPPRTLPKDCTSGRSKDYFDGGLPNLSTIPQNDCTSSPQHNDQFNNDQPEQCGLVTRYGAVPLVIEGKPTYEGQWPWQIALYQYQSVNNKYLCGGSLISRRHVTTAAHCVTRPGTSLIVVNNTLTVFLGKHNLRTSVNGVQIRYVKTINLHPEYNGQYRHDAAILTLDMPVQITDLVRTVCLWPEQYSDLDYVVGKIGSVVGWGFDGNGQPSEQLALVEMPVVTQDTCSRSHIGGFFLRYTSNYTYCAGYRDGSSVCNGDSGGGMVFNIQNVWYLRGMVSLSVSRGKNRCDPSHYVIFTDLAKMLPWIHSVIRNN